MILKHFIDSLTILKHLRGTVLADIGTGAGFPGIPLKIIQKGLHVVLVDSLNKRLDFLKEVIMRLGINGVDVVHSRAEDLGRNPKYRAGFDVVTSRAVAKLPVLLEYAIPLLKLRGTFIAMKGSQVDEELIAAQGALIRLGAGVKAVEKFSLGPEAENRSIVIVQKQTVTPKEYPRKPGIPSKAPLA